jgi:tRNA modification GTPase
MDSILFEDTICAIATPIGEGGIGIIKISGPEAQEIAAKLFRPYTSSDSFESHRLQYGTIRDPNSQEVVDEVLLSFMAGPHTYTRENVVEINCHGGYLVLSRVLELALQGGCRLAEPGEFTRRAFLNGRIDLSQAEAVLDIIHSRSEQSLLMANRHLRGDFRERIAAWRDQLFRLHTEVEACIDFSDDLEEDPSLSQSLALGLEEVIVPLEQALAGYDRGRILREGLTLVLVGKPNVGKSSLLNALLGKDRAIVTPIPGTTRDIIEDSFLLSGVLVKILDTAGIRLKPDGIESIGIERTLASVVEADVVLWLIDQSQPLTEEDDRVYTAVSSQRYVVLLNKSDLPPVVPVEEVTKRYNLDKPAFSLSVFNSADIDKLRTQLTDTFLKRPLQMSPSAIVPNLRQKGCFEQAIASLHRAKTLVEESSYTELVSLELHSARRYLDLVLGIEADDDLLDSIFSQFCIGK